MVCRHDRVDDFTTIHTLLNGVNWTRLLLHARTEMWTRHAPRAPLPDLLHPQEPLVVLFRHIEKTGGSSLGSSFAASHCQYFGYDFARNTRQRLRLFITNFSSYKELQPKPPNEAFNNHSSTVACVEAHSPAPDAAQIVSFGADSFLATRILLVLVVRRPQEQYQSFFRWSHKPLSANETSQSFSSRFLRWAPPNLQANIFRHSYRATIAKAWCCGQPSSMCCSENSRASRIPPTFETNGTFCTDVLSAARTFDVVLPTESLSSVGLEVLRHLTGLELPTRHVKVPPAYQGREHTVVLPPPVDEDSDVNFIRLTQEERAPCDWQLHELAALRLAKVVPVAGASRD